MEEILNLKLSEVRPSPFNPRKHLGDLTELAASIKQVGVLEPAIARFVNEGYELVFGHRRRAACELASVDTLPCIVRPYTDDQVIEVQIIENGQRADVHPLDEADGYQTLIARGRTVAEIADRVGRPRAYIAQRLELCNLSKAGCKAFDDEEITLGAALALARVPGKLQDEALEQVLEWRSYGATGDASAISGKAVREHIEEHFMLRLERAPWPLDDAKLSKKAGACTVCPKRTGNQPELFDDVKTKDLCTDTACYRSKLALYWPTRAKAAAAAGQTILEGKAAAKALSYSGCFEKLDSTTYLSNGKSLSVRKLVEKSGAAVALALDPETNEHIELVRGADLEKAKQAAAPKGEAKSGGGAHDYRAEERKREAQERRRRRVVELAIGAAVDEAEVRVQKHPLAHTVSSCIDAIIVGGIVRAWAETLSTIIKRRELAPKKVKAGAASRSSASRPEAIVLKAFDAMSRPARVGFGVELGLLSMAPSPHNVKRHDWIDALKAMGVNLDKIEKQVADEERERAAKTKKKPGKAAKASAGKAPANA